MNRPAFSLLEIIIATAVLAASAMVLSSLISLGARYGNRAEERTLALVQAESLLDEYIAQLSTSTTDREVTGSLKSPKPIAFRIRATPYEIGMQNSSRGGGERLQKQDDGLLLVNVELFESDGRDVLLAGAESRPLVSVHRLVRNPIRTKLQDPTVAAPLSEGGF